MPKPIIILSTDPHWIGPIVKHLVAEFGFTTWEEVASVEDEQVLTLDSFHVYIGMLDRAVTHHVCPEHAKLVRSFARIQLGLETAIPTNDLNYSETSILARAFIISWEGLAAATDEELLSHHGVGPHRVQLLRCRQRESGF